MVFIFVMAMILLCPVFGPGLAFVLAVCAVIRFCTSIGDDYGPERKRSCSCKRGPGGRFC